MTFKTAKYSGLISIFSSTLLAALSVSNVNAADVVKIGSAAPLTGGISHLGKDNENGARLAIEEANKKGIKIAGKAVTFELVGEDDQGDEKQGPIVAQRLLDAGVVGVVGHLNSGVSIPASPVYAQAGVPQISPSSTNPKYTEQGLATTFRVVGRDDQQGPAVAKFIANLKPKTLAIIDDSTAYGAGLADQVALTAKKLGIKVLPREKGTDKTIDWKAVLTKVKGGKPDAVFYGGMDATGGPLMKQARELGITATFAYGDGACTDKMGELAGKAAEGLVCSQAGIPPQAAGKAFTEAYKARFKTDPILYSPFSYDGANMMIEAMVKAKSTDPKVYLPVLKANKYQGTTGQIEFDSKGDRKNAEITIFKMQNGKVEPVAIVQGDKSVSYQEFISKKK